MKKMVRISRLLAALSVLSLSGLNTVLAGTLADSPLSLKGAVPPNVLFSLSVEFPTAVSAAYMGSYSPDNEFVGYFDSSKCYSYDSTNGWFVPVGAATGHACSGEWSGNFLNWASMTGLDEFRFAMSGGNRYVDTATETVLERSYIDSHGGTSNFPNKNYTGAGASPYPTIAVVNAYKGVKMTVTGSGTDSISCSSPTLAGSFACSLAVASTGDAVTCSTWAGDGASASTPYRCSSFGTGLPVGATATAGTPTTFSTTPVADTVSCASPTFTAGSFSCNLSLASSSSTGTCSTWVGTGTSVDPYYCSSFGSFGAVNFTTESRGAPSSFEVTTTSTTKYYVPSYAGTSGATKYYVPSYSLSFAGARDYYVRVKVCDASVGLESHCKAYGTSYKPTGVLQDEGDSMKFGVFSYYNSNDVDNAVMRSKAKYLAPQKYSSSGGTVANTAKEWSDTDGTLVADPDPAERTNSYPVGSNPSRSGVINYINKFGRPVDPLPATAPSRYKTYDSVGKLYYETLKYLRGGAATTHFYQNATAANNDDFPIITTWDDPIEYSCQKNYIITLGDKNTHCDKRLPGGTFTTAGSGQCSAQPEADDYGSFTETGVSPTVNVATWTSAIDVLDPVNMSGTTGAGSASWYMAGLAYWAAKNDIRQDVATSPKTLGKQKVKTYVIDVEEYGALSNNAQYGMATKYGGADSFDADGRPIDSTQSVTISGTTYAWPKTLLRASDPNKMITSVRSAIADIAAQIGNESALAQSSGNLQTGYGAYIYRALFNSGGWTGDVEAFFINNRGEIESTPTWEASAKLPGHAERRILTYNDGLQADGTAETFSNSRSGTVFAAASASDFTSNFSSRQRDLLNRDALGAVDGNGIARVSYLRGDDINEGAGLGFRSRSSLLGDMVNSNPLFVGPPIIGLSGNGYNAFAKGIVGRTPVVYVGSNDGMLHGFDASVDSSGEATSTAGTELFAYVPSSIYGKLSQLTSPIYSHQYYVDGSPVASEACFADCDSGDDPVWKTVLVGGLNAGGQGIYALDVTDPSSFASAAPSSLVLWEFTDKDDPHLGYTFGKPVIRKLNNGKWAVIFGNGFNNTANDGNSSTTGHSYLYVLLVSGPTGAGNTWQLGTDYFRIELKQPPIGGVAPTLPLSPASGMASVAAVDADVNGTADLVYGGDRYGNIWKIDLSSDDPNDWKSAFDDGAADENPLPLFTTSDGASTPKAQQVTTGVELSRHPKGGYLLFVGTGSYVDVTDPLSPFQTQTYYGLWDKNDEAKTRITSRDSLQKQKLLGFDSATFSGETYYAMSDCAVNYTNSVIAAGNVSVPLCPSTIGTASNLAPQLGWMFDLPDSGERVVSDRPLLQAGVLTFTTLTPSVDPCTGNTVGKVYDLDYLTGGAIPIYDVNGDGVINSSDYISITVTDTSGATTTIRVPVSGQLLKGGASDTPVRFNLAKKLRPDDTTSTATCPDFVPGWGCLSEMNRAKSCKPVIEGNGGGIGDEAPDLTTARKCLYAPSGRLVWKEILQ